MAEAETARRKVVLRNFFLFLHHHIIRLVEADIDLRAIAVVATGIVIAVGADLDVGVAD